jgi:hypothetical protein
VTLLLLLTYELQSSSVSTVRGNGVRGQGSVTRGGPAQLCQYSDMIQPEEPGFGYKRWAGISEAGRDYTEWAGIAQSVQ